MADEDEDSGGDGELRVPRAQAAAPGGDHGDTEAALDGLEAVLDEVAATLARMG